MVLVGAGAYEIQRLTVARGALLEQPRHLHFAKRRGQSGQSAGLESGRDLVEQLIDGLGSDDRKHARHIVGSMRDERHGCSYCASARYCSYSAAVSIAPLGAAPSTCTRINQPAP